MLLIGFFAKYLHFAAIELVLWIPAHLAISSFISMHLYIAHYKNVSIYDIIVFGMVVCYMLYKIFSGLKIYTTHITLVFLYCSSPYLMFLPHMVEEGCLAVSDLFTH